MKTRQLFKLPAFRSRTIHIRLALGINRTIILRTTIQFSALNSPHHHSAHHRPWNDTAREPSQYTEAYYPDSAHER